MQTQKRNNNLPSDPLTQRETKRKNAKIKINSNQELSYCLNSKNSSNVQLIKKQRWWVGGGCLLFSFFDNGDLAKMKNLSKL